MRANDYWNFAIGVSLAAHFGVIAAYYPAISKNMAINENKEVKEIKITVKEVIKEKISKDEQGSKYEKGSNSLPPPPYINNVMRKLMGNDEEKPFLDKPQILEKDSNGVIIFEKLENANLRNNPSYMSYYNGLRSKLYEISRKRYKGNMIGEVSLNFSLFRDGTLEYVKGEGANRQLVDLAITIVKESAPFTPFPKDLKNHSCPFHISVLFKNK